jgi:type IV pilus biogenesis/stability protein PilW
MTPWIRMAILGLAAGALTACATPEAELAKQESAQTHYTVGIGALADGNLRKAISELQTAVEEDPRNARHHHALGNAYLRNKQIDEAMASFRQAVELNPSMSDAYNDLGVAYMQRQQWELAIGAFRKALANPQYANPERSYMNLGIIYHLRGQYDRAADEFNKWLDVYPQSADAHFFLGRTLLAQGKLADARDHLDQAVKLEGTVPIFHLELGVARLRSGQRAAARESFRRVVELNPNSPEAEQARRYLRELN